MSIWCNLPPQFGGHVFHFKEGPYFTSSLCHTSISSPDDSTLMKNSSKESTQARERKRNKGQGPKSMQANSPKEAGHKEARESLSTQTSTSHLKHIN